jgi:DNA-binding transcriptional MerR regulator
MWPGIGGDMESWLTIHEAATETGLTTHTLRYYERVGLIPSVARAANGHRRYSEEDLGWIEFVKCLRSTGMPISEMQRYVELEAQGDSTARARLELLEAHRQRIKVKMKQLEAFLERIEGKIVYYRELQSRRLS